MSREGADAALPHTDRWAIASLIFGILGMFVVTTIPALLCGYIAKHRIEESGGQLVGRGMAVAGIILGWTLLGLSVFIIGTLTVVEGGY